MDLTLHLHPDAPVDPDPGEGKAIVGKAVVGKNTAG